MEILGGGYDPNDVNIIRGRRKNADLSSVHINSWEENFYEKLRKLNKIVLLSGAFVLATGSVITWGAVKYGQVNDSVSNEYTKDEAIVNFYEEQKYLANPNAEFYNDYKRYDELVEKLPQYVDVSEKLHDLKLDKYDDVTCFDDAVLFVEPEKMDQLIDAYKENLNKINDKFNDRNMVGNDVVTLNHQVYELKELEKMYNERVYNGYQYLEEYGLASTKSYLSDIYGGKPEEYKIQLNDYQHDGYKEITGPGIHYGDGFDGDVLKYVDTLANVYKADNAAVQADPESYNHDRNKAIAKAVSDYNRLGANIIEDIEKANKKK